MRHTAGILGIPIDVINTVGALERLEQFIAERRFHQVATANVDFLLNAVADSEMRDILRGADLVTPDGMPLVWASRLVGAPLPERVTGADLVPMIAALAARKGYRIYMLGARPEVAQRARERLMDAYPDLQIVGCLSPEVCSLLNMDHEAMLQDIERARPDILLVAFGNPKQEKWIHLHRERLQHVPVCIGVGGTFDFIAGDTRRAPQWMQHTGLEWLYRLWQEPRRLARRYTRDLIWFPCLLARQIWAARTGRSLAEIPADLELASATPMQQAESGLEIQTCTCSDEAVYTFSGRATTDQVRCVEERLCSLPSYVRQLDLDLRSVSYIDCGMIAVLRRCADTLRLEGVRMRLIPGPAVSATLAREQVLAHFEVVERPSAVCTNPYPVPIYRERQRQAY